MKRGAEGPLALGHDTMEGDFDAVQSVVDTTAAGDSFNAGFLNQVAIGGDVKSAMEAGHRLASKVIQQHGAIVELDG